MALVNERFQVKSFPTAITTDLLFYEVHDSVLPKNKQPAYGSPHPNHQVYPNHVLTYIEAREEEGKQNWYYAAKRETQDLYNWEFSEADLGGTRFPSVNRTYVTLREEFDPDTPAQGAAMANVPEDVFDGEYVLSSRVQKRSDKQLDSVFVVEQRTYVKKSVFSEIVYDEKTGRGDRNTTTLYYADEIVTGDLTAAQLFLDETNSYWGLQPDGAFRKGQQISAEWFQVDSQSVIPANAAITVGNPAKTRIINRVTPLGTDVLFTETGAMPDPAPEYGSAHYDTVSWPNHKLVLIKPADASGLLYEFFYAADRENQDLYNWEIVAGTDLTRTYLIPRNLYRAKPVGDVDALAGEFLYPPAGVASPDSVFSAYCFVDDTVRRVDESLDSIYVTIQRRFIEPITSDYIYDDSLKKSIRVLKEVIPSTENGAPTNPQPGTVVEIKKGNFFHNVKITQTIVLGVGVTYPYALPDLPGSYDRAFPAKLDSISLVAAWAEADSSTHAKSYSEDYYFKFKITEARPGPYSAVIKRYVTNNPSGIQALFPVTIVPQPVTETIAVVASWFHASTKGNSTFAIAKEWSVPATIHGLVNVDVGGVFNTRKSNAYYTESVAATPGAATFLGLTQITSDFKVRQLPLGLYEVSVVVVNISNLY